MKLRQTALGVATFAAIILWSGVASASLQISTTGWTRASVSPASQPLSLVGDGGNNTSSGGVFQFTRGSTNPSDPAIWNIDTGTYTTGVGSKFSAFCIDLVQNLAGSAVYDLVDPSLAPTPSSGSSPLAPMGSLAAERLGVLWYRHVHGSGGTDGVDTPKGMAAMQLAIWEIVYDSQLSGGVLSLTAGNLTATGSGTSGTVAYLAKSWLDDIGAIDFDTYAGPTAYVLAMNDTGTPDTQNQLVEVVPEPASIAVWSILAGAAAGLSVAKRRRRVEPGRWADDNRNAIFAIIENGDPRH